MEPMIVPIDPSDPSKGMQVVLRCVECKKHLQPSNVHNLSKSHFNSDGKCKAGPKHQGASSSSGQGSSASGGSSSGGQGGGLRSFVVSESQQTQAVDAVVKYLVTKGCPSHVEDPLLREAFKKLGCTLPSEYLALQSWFAVGPKQPTDGDIHADQCRAQLRTDDQI
jgi:hypothetical protein